jgi:LPXTG-motif cell wall-anchored protein
MVSGSLVASFAGLALTSPAYAANASVGPIDFEGYTVGNVNGQNGWSKTGAYDVEVENVADYPAASGYGFQTKSLRASNFFADGAFGGQAFSPGLTQAAGEGDAASYFTASFEIGTTKAEQQPGLAVSASPDDGNGGRMSYLRFNDEADGVHVVFVDVTATGTPATFNPDVPIATLDRAHSHAIRFEIAFVDGPGTAGVGNDVVKIFVDGALEHTGTTWENYYRYDAEAAGNGNTIPTTSKLLFAARGAPALAVGLNQGYLIDDVALSSSTTAPVPSGPPTAPSANYDGNKRCADFDAAYKEFKIEGVPANGIHDDPNSDLVITISNSSSQTFDWASNQDISAVLVKGGAGGGGVKFAYPGVNDLGDTGLHALLHDANKPEPYYGISHVTFCYRVGGDTPPPVDQPVTPQPEAPKPGNPNPGNPNATNPNATNPTATNPNATVQPNTEVLGVTLTQDATLPRTGGTTTQPLALAGGLGLALGLAMLLLASRRTAVENH